MADNPTKKLRVFLCHASDDKPTVRELYNRLVADGFDAWFDEVNLLPGQEWRYEIPKAVHLADAFIICISNNSTNKEGYVQKEITFALDIAEEKPQGAVYIIPARLEICDVPYRLSHWQWVDLFREGEYERLKTSLEIRAKDLNESLLGINRNKTAKKIAQEKSRKRIIQGTKPQVDRMPVQEKIEQELDETMKTDVFQNTMAHPKWISVLWITLGWALGWLIGGTTNWVIAGAIGGLTIALTLKLEKILSSGKSMLWITLGWAIGWAFSNYLSDAINWTNASTVAVGWTINGAIVGTIGGFATAYTLKQEKILPDEKSSLWIILGWVFGWAVGWNGLLAISFANFFFSMVIVDSIWKFAMVFVGIIGGAIGGYFTIFTIRKNRM